MTLRLYINGTAGQRDGTPISGTDSLGSLLAGNVAAISALDTAQNLFVREDVGYRTYAEVTANVLNSAKADDADYTLTDADQTDAASLNLGYVGDVNVPLSIKQLVGKSDRTAYLRLTYGGAPVALPAITAGPSISAVTASGCTITATLNASVSGAKYIVKANNSAPSAGDWTGASAFTSPQSVSGLTPSTLYYVFVRVVDAVGFEAVSAAQSFTTSVTSNLGPSFTSQPAVKSGTTTIDGFTVEYGATDSDGDSITHEISTDNGSNYASITPTFNSGTGKYEYALTGLSAGTTYSVKVRLSDATHTGANGTASNTLSATTNAIADVSGFNAAGATPTTIALTWDATANAASYVIEWGTDGVTYGNTISPEPTTNLYTHTGRTLDQTIYYRIKAKTAGGSLSANYATDTGAATDTFSDSFTSLDTDRWGTATAGSGSVSVVGGELVMDSTAGVSSGAAAYLKYTVPSGTRTYRHKFKTTAGNADTLWGLAVMNGTSVAIDTSANNFAKTLVMFRVSDNGNGTGNGNLTYYDSSNTLQRWNGTGWQTAAVSITKAAYAGNTFMYVDLEVTSTQWRLTTRDVNLAVVDQTAWVNWSGTRSATNKVIAFGDMFSDIHACTIKSDSFVVS